MTEEERNALVVILGAAVLAPVAANWVSGRVRLPSVVLEIVLGILIGPHVLGWVRIDHLVDVFATIGMLLLFFSAGFEIDFKGIRGRPTWLASVGWFVSVAVGFAIGQLLDVSGLVSSAVIVALAMTTTALGTLLPMLRDAGERRRRSDVLSSPQGRSANSARPS
jgi:Kef-type K+ transport system membrane component KefB